jgi:CRISPR type III-A-associated protein Csm2
MEEEVQQEATAAQAVPAEEPKSTEPLQAEPPKAEPQKVESPKPEAQRSEPKPQGPRREDRPPRPGGGENRGERREGARPGGDRGPRPEHRVDRPDRGGDRREGGRPGGPRPFDGPSEIELEKLISDSLYLDNQAHAVVMRMRDMDSGTKSQLRRLYNAVRRAVRAPESERQHHFVMLRARLAYTIARHSLRSLDALERLLLQVTRRNDARGYERFKDLFEAIVAYNE